MKLMSSFLLAASIFAHAEVKVSVGEISDKRTTGKFFAGLDLELKLSGPELAECKGLRVVVKEAKDDTGKVVKVSENRFGGGGFEAPRQSFGGGFGEQKKDESAAKIELENPARGAKTIALDGVVELLIPSKDPAAVVTVDVAKQAGKALENDPIKAAGITLTFKAPKDSEAGYTIADPKQKVASVEFCSADGKPLETQGSMSSGFGGKKDVTINLRNAVPGMTAKVYLLTEKSLVAVPLKLNGVTLP